MTFIGKLMVVLLTVLSLTMVTWAAGIYTQRLDWYPDKTLGPDQAKGRIAKLQDDIQVLLATKQQAEKLWTDNYVRMRTLEADRIARQQWYAGQLELLRTGKLNGQDVAPAVQQLAPDAIDPTQPLPSPTNRQPELGADGQPLKAIEVYDRLIAAHLRTLSNDDPQMPGLQQQIAAVIAEEEVLTNEITGTTVDGQLIKGLRMKIDEQREIALDSQAEREYIVPFLTNRRADLEMVLRRQTSLQARVDEVKRYLGSFTER